MLPAMVSPGDWVLDVGANVGHYTLELSKLVGAQGRVIAFEPVPEAFEVLVANSRLAPHRNITLINAATSDTTRASGMVIPRYEDTGLDNLYLAHLSDGGAGLQVLCVTIDSLALPVPIRFAKVDTEGHELATLRGMERLLRRDRPALVVEDNDREVYAFLAALGYQPEKVPGSSNTIFQYHAGVPTPERVNPGAADPCSRNIASSSSASSSSSTRS
jgi:FkbM family methyltransferase